MDRLNYNSNKVAASELSIAECVKNRRACHDFVKLGQRSKRARKRECALESYRSVVACSLSRGFCWWITVLGGGAMT